MNHKPLAGFRVLEVGAYISAPYCGALLAAMGADVVKVEPLEGEAFRRSKGVDDPYFVQYNAGKRSLAVNLKSESGVQLIESLLPKFDVLFENMRPGKMDSLGLGADRCAQINPGLVYASISGFGNGGPLRDHPAFDTIGQSYGGLYSVMNDAQDRRLTGTCLADLTTALCTCLGIVSALAGRERAGAGRGMRVETSVFEAMSALTIDAMTQAMASDVDPVRDSRHPQAVNFCLATACGQAITMHLSVSDKFWRALMREVGRPELIDDPRFRTYGDRAIRENYFALKQILEGEFLKRTRAEWEAALTKADVPFAPVLTLKELAVHPQTQWLQLITGLPQGGALVRPPWRFDGDRPVREQHVPQIGEHSREVLREILPEAEIDTLMAKGTVAGPRSVA